MKRRRKYPRCQYYRDKRHRFGVNNLSFVEVCMYRDGNPDDTCKCGFDRKDWRGGSSPATKEISSTDDVTNSKGETNNG